MAIYELIKRRDMRVERSERGAVTIIDGGGQNQKAFNATSPSLQPINLIAFQRCWLTGGARQSSVCTGAPRARRGDCGGTLGPRWTAMDRDSPPAILVSLDSPEVVAVVQNSK